MNDVTRRVESLLETWENSWEDSGWSMFAYDYDVGEEFDVPGLGTVEKVEEYVGGEGDYDVATYLVFKITDVTGVERYYRKNGRYASHVGTDWDGSFKEVIPQEKTVTVYE